ncbi:MAG: prepilin-type N-terminal cleavage/methylation domain-containing protein [Candidatus Saccharibacteria bacterium]|nr:prepilin-type N-terminal cleavage/methylation domain-containing protein [Candidatus Saccharibacteria bacterium]
MRRGFTLIELSLSLVFIGILSVIVVLMINNTVVAYRRGLTLSQINTAGMDLVDDLRTAVMNSSSDGVSALCVTYYANNGSVRGQCEEDGAYRFVTVNRTANVTLNKNGVEENVGVVPVYGAFCAGTYSYIWNSGYFFNDTEGLDDTERIVSASPATLEYVFNGTTHTASGFKLLKIRDDNRSVCASVARGNNFEVDQYTLINGDAPNEFKISVYGELSEEPVELISTDQNNDLVLYDLDVPRPAESTTQENMLYSASFILGTIRGGINIKANGKSCEPPENHAIEQFDYCAINKFKFAVQAGGE